MSPKGLDNFKQVSPCSRLLPRPRPQRSGGVSAAPGEAQNNKVAPGRSIVTEGSLLLGCTFPLGMASIVIT